MSNKYIRIFFVVAVGLVMVLQPSGAAEAVSLWADSGPGASMYSDHRAHSIGDIITIIISETSTASRVGSSNNSKTTSTKMNAGTGIFSALASASAGNSDSFKSAGTITNSNNVSGTITVAVTEIKPNGNLIISGTQSIKQNNEEQKITITGEVRPEDIKSDNTVASSLVANAQLKFDGKGPISSKQRQGIITRIFDFLF